MDEGRILCVWVGDVELELTERVAVAVDDWFRDKESPKGNAESDWRVFVLTRGESVTTVPTGAVVEPCGTEDNVPSVAVGLKVLAVGLGDAVFDGDTVTKGDVVGFSGWATGIA